MQQETQLVVIISLVAMSITILSFAGLINPASILGSGDYIERPVFYYDKCEAIGAYDKSVDYALATAGQWVNRPSVTNAYDVIVSTPVTLGMLSTGLLPITGHRVEYYVCNSKVFSESNCDIYSKFITTGNPVTISNVRPNEYVWVQYQNCHYLSYPGWLEHNHIVF